MNKNLLSEKYSSSLFQVALKEKKLGVIEKEIKKCKTLFENVPELLEFLSAPIRTEKQLVSVVEDIANREKFSPQTESFLLAIAKNNRFSCFPNICDKFFVLCNKHNKKIEFTITSAEKISSSKLKEIQKTLEEITSSKVILKQELDEEIISGFTLKYGSVLIDYSYENQLKQIKKLSFQELELYKLSEMS